MKSEQESQEEPTKQPKYETGEPGSIGRQGEFEEAHGNVWPASGPPAPADAKIQPMASWGQGARGAAGYEDTGPSEMSWLGSSGEQRPEVKRRKLGRSDLEIGPLVFGGNVLGWTVDEPVAFDLLDAFVDAGFNAIDTADVYSRWVPGHQGGESETMLGKWFQRSGKRGQVVLATKVGMEMGPGRKGLSKAYILKSAEGSLRHLQTDYIDLYQAHADDPDTPLEETLDAFGQLIKQGKVRAIGASNYSAARLKQALEIARQRGGPGYVSLQPLYNLYHRADFEAELEPLCRDNGLGVITYFSLASGFLSGKYRSEADLEDRARGSRVKQYLNPRGFRILEALDRVARELNSTPASVAIAWLLTRPTVTAPIASATNLDQLRELVAATQLELSPDAVAQLDHASE